VTVSLANVTAAIKNSSTDAQLDLRITIPTSAGVGTGNLTFQRAFGANQSLNNSITINAVTVTGVVPNSGAQGSQVNVVISGTCFDPTTAIKQVSVSGLGVNVSNVVVVDDHTITCTLDVGGVAPKTARDVSVKLGLAPAVVLANGFSVV